MPQLFHKCRRGRIPQPARRWLLLSWQRGQQWREANSHDKRVTIIHGTGQGGLHCPRRLPNKLCLLIIHGLGTISQAPCRALGTPRGLRHLLSMSAQARGRRLTTDPHNAMWCVPCREVSTALREQRRKHLATIGHPGRLSRGGGVCPELMLPSSISPKLLLGTAAQSSTELDTTHTGVPAFLTHYYSTVHVRRQPEKSESDLQIILFPGKKPTKKQIIYTKGENYWY